MKAWVGGVVGWLVLCGSVQASTLPSPDIERVFMVVMENRAAHRAYTQPFMKKLADEGAFFERSYGVARPSQPNYIALTSGATWRVVSNARVTLDVTHLGDLLEAAGKTWKTYAEGYPGNCYLGSTKGDYARKHVPFLSYKNVQENPERCARVVNADELKRDVEERRLADFSLYIPDNQNNSHDTDLEHADRWLEKTFKPLLSRRRFAEGTLFILTFDEDDYRNENHIYTAFWGPMVEPGSRVKTRVTHYNVLRTIEEALRLGTLGRNDKKAEPVSGIWR